MTELHLIVGVSVLVLNLIAGVWGGIDWVRQGPGAKGAAAAAYKPSPGFWYALRAAQIAVVIQVMLGALLIFGGHEAVNGLHYVYGALPLAVSLLAEMARAGAASQELGDTDFRALPEAEQRSLALAIVRRETGIMAVSALVIFLVALRAAGTSSAF